MSTQSRLLVVTNTFTNNSPSQFSYSLTALPWAPKRWILKQLGYDGVNDVGVVGPLVLECAAMGGPLGIFSSGGSGVGVPFIATSMTNTATNYNTANITISPVAFRVTQNGSTINTLQGTLTFLLEAQMDFERDKSGFEVEKKGL
jgi:hypothetical protein